MVKFASDPDGFGIFLHVFLSVGCVLVEIDCKGFDFFSELRVRLV